MDGVLVVIDLGEDGVKVHERAAVGNVEGQYGADLGVGVGKEIACRGLDAVGGGALGDTDRDGVLGEVQYIAALNVRVEVTVIVAGDKPLEVGVVPEDVVGIDSLTASGREAHPVQKYAGADGRERVAREV